MSERPKSRGKQKAPAQQKLVPDKPMSKQPVQEQPVGQKPSAEKPAAQQAPKQKKNAAPWTEKYRPRNLEEVRGNKTIIEKMKALARSESVQNILLAGKEGIGKTTIAFILARIFSGGVVQNIKSINASAFGSIKVLRNEIIPFCKASTIYSGKKVIILDEFDAASAAMQFGFRRVLEDYTRTGEAVFILCCNYDRKIIPAIKSRCMNYRLKPLSNDELTNYGEFILQSEKIVFTDEILAAIIPLAKGKPRDLINLLQQNIIEKTLTMPEQAEIESDLKKILKAIFKDNDLNAAFSSYDDLVNAYGVDERMILDSLKDLITSNPETIKRADGSFDVGMPNVSKAYLLAELGDTDKCIAEGATPDIQMHRLLSRFFILGPAIKKNKDETRVKLATMVTKANKPAAVS